MTQVLSLMTVVTLLLLAGQPAPSFTWPLGPGLHESNGPSLKGEIGGHQGPGLACRPDPHPGQDRSCPLDATFVGHQGPGLNGAYTGHQGPSLNGAFIGHQGPTLNGPYSGHQGPSLNGADALDPMIRGLAVEGLELRDGTRLGR